MRSELLNYYGGMFDAYISLLDQLEDARNKRSEISTKMYNSVLDAHEKSKDEEKRLKDIMKEVQALNKEKETVEKQQTEALKRQTAHELDVKDLDERIYGNSQAKVIF